MFDALVRRIYIATTQCALSKSDADDAAGQAPEAQTSRADLQS